MVKLNSRTQDLVGKRFSHWLVGKRFSRWEVLSFAGKRESDGRVLWNCKCDCGNERVVPAKTLLNGDSKSCGCFKLEMLLQRSTKHGNASNDSKLFGFYRSWKSLKERCNNPKSTCYKNYGGRGITYKSRWEEFENFKQDMLIAYRLARRDFGRNATLTIERKDVNGNYCKENCEWIPNEWQAKNKSNNRWFKAISPNKEEFVSKNQREFAREHNLYHSHISRCLNGYVEYYRGWKFEFVEVKRERKTKRNKLKSI